MSCGFFSTNNSVEQPRIVSSMQRTFCLKRQRAFGVCVVPPVKKLHWTHFLYFFSLSARRTGLPKLACFVVNTKTLRVRKAGLWVRTGSSLCCTKEQCYLFRVSVVSAQSAKIKARTHSPQEELVRLNSGCTNDSP